jgi:hypothetical protein
MEDIAGKLRLESSLAAISTQLSAKATTLCFLLIADR